jgi:hypothetical protein
MGTMTDKVSAGRALLLSRKLTASQVAVLKARAGIAPNPNAEADRQAAIAAILQRRVSARKSARRMTEADVMKEMGVDWIAWEFEQAAKTLRHLHDSRLKPKQPQAAWPDVVRSSWENYGSERAKASLTEVNNRITPTSDQISRMDRCLQWLHWLTPRERKIVWARACGLALRKVAVMFGCGKTTVSTDHLTALFTIALRLQGRK